MLLYSLKGNQGTSHTKTLTPSPPWTIYCPAKLQSAAHCCSSSVQTETFAGVWSENPAKVHQWRRGRTWRDLLQPLSNYIRVNWYYIFMLLDHLNQDLKVDINNKIREDGFNPKKECRSTREPPCFINLTGMSDEFCCMIFQRRKKILSCISCLKMSRNSTRPHEGLYSVLGADFQ